LATAIARGISTVATLWILASRRAMRSFGRGVLEQIGASWRELLRIGVPAAGTNVIVPVTTAILTRLVADYGEPAVAAYGAGSRIESMAILVFFSLSSGLSPIVGQSWGADLKERVIETVSLSQKVAIGWGALTFALFTLGSSWLAGAFVEGEQAAEHLALYLLLVPIGHAPQGVFLVCNAALNAIDRPVQAATLSVTRTLVLTAPMAWIASWWFDLAGIFASIAAANLLIGLGAALWTRHILRTAK
jgi:Na+-driven multidrug efflux pump